MDSGIQGSCNLWGAKGPAAATQDKTISNDTMVTAMVPVNPSMTIETNDGNENDTDNGSGSSLPPPEIRKGNYGTCLKNTGR